MTTRLRTDDELELLRAMRKRVTNPGARWSDMPTGAQVVTRPDGALMLRTHFEFPDGDRFPIHLSETGIGGLRLSDRGHTLMHISYDHDVDVFLDGTRGRMLERIEGKSDVPLFLYGVPNRNKARLTTIMLSHFHRHGLQFESMLVFEDQSEIPRLDLARLSDVGGEMISSLESSADLGRKLLQRVA